MYLLKIMKVNPYIFVGLDSDTKENFIPLSTIDQTVEILNLSKDLHRVGEFKQNKNTTAPAKYIGLLVAKKLLGYKNFNQMAKQFESIHGFPKRSSIVHSLMDYEDLVRLNKPMRAKYNELLKLSKEKLKLNNSQ